MNNINYNFNEKNKQNIENLIKVSQIHSNICHIVDDRKKISSLQNIPEADAIITNLVNIKISVKTADCVPVFLYCYKPKIIAAIHAGWKGAKSNIIANSIKSLKKLNGEISNITAIIGPCIHQSSYEVEKEFYNNFINEDKKFTAFFKNKSPNKFLFNLPSFVESKLKAEGVNKIENVNINTYSNNNFYSYRKFCHGLQKENGRNISWIEIL
jgi:polyphenol oxidase